jgi:hypothetical protein
MELNDLLTTESHGVGAEMRVRGPDGNLTDCYITLVGVDSDLWDKVMTESRDTLIKAGKQGRNAIVKIKAGMIADASLAWRGFTFNGEEIEFSREKALELYISAPYIMTQCDGFIAERANFMKG